PCTMATITKRKPPSTATVPLRGHRGRTATCGSLAEARRWAARTRADVRSGSLPRGLRPAHTVREPPDRYLESSRFAVLKDRVNYVYQLEWWRDKIGHLRLPDLTPFLLREARDLLLDKPMNPATANRYMAALSAVLTYAVSDLAWIDA